MTTTVTWALVLSAFGVVIVRRRMVAIVLIAIQSLLLGAAAINDAAGVSSALLVAGVVLLVKALVVPVLLAVVVARTSETQRIVSERHPLARLAVALAVALAIVALMPRLGLTHPGVEHVAVGLVALGIATAAVRRAAIFQALGFLIAENGLYLAALSTPGGLPAFIELGVVFDLVVVVSVVGAFSAKIHEQLGSGDTSLLGDLRD
jgi:hydrogenase-4 component E